LSDEATVPAEGVEVILGCLGPDRPPPEANPIAEHSELDTHGDGPVGQPVGNERVVVKVRTCVLSREWLPKSTKRGIV